jgi:hypothetical protein
MYRVAPRPHVVARRAIWFAALASASLCIACGGSDFKVGASPDDDGGADADSSDSSGLGETSKDTGIRSDSDSGIGSDGGSDGGPETEAGVDSGEIGIDTGIDAGVDTALSVKRVFVSSALYTGNLGGLAGADAKCQALADAAKLGGTYRAWLSDVKTNARTRLVHSTVPYVLVDGTVVASDWFALVSGSLDHAINKTESGGVPPMGTLICLAGSPSVWTLTGTGGAVQGNYDCSGWMSGSISSDAGSIEMVWGVADSKDSKWTAACTSQQCGPKTASLYCVEQ